MIRRVPQMSFCRSTLEERNLLLARLEEQKAQVHRAEEEMLTQERIDRLLNRLQRGLKKKPKRKQTFRKRAVNFISRIFSSKRNQENSAAQDVGAEAESDFNEGESFDADDQAPVTAEDLLRRVEQQPDDRRGQRPIGTEMNRLATIQRPSCHRRSMA